MIKQCIICFKELDGLKTKFCSNNCKVKGHYHRIKEQSNTYHSQTIRSYKRKIALIEMSGGGCKKCGYNKNMAALHFHHIHPDQKSFKLDVRKLSNKKWEYIVIEYKKCDLLCANCHSEHHNPEMELNNVKLIIGQDALSRRTQMINTTLL